MHLWLKEQSSKVMKFGSILDDEPAFQFKSVFSYSRIPGSEEEILSSCYSGTVPDKPPGATEKVMRSLLLALTYSAFLLTFPVSAWFCVKKVNALERCVIFRLGQRLPLKGPGYVFTLPCLDVLDVIDLNPHDFKVVDNTQLLTSDGSVIEIKSFDITVAVSDAVKSFTQLKDSRSNVEQFIRLSFLNLVASSHVEDLERKIDWIMKDFVINCNNYINRWGWEITCSTPIPKFTVISRADPSNPLMDALKAYFNPGGNSSNSAPAQIPTTSSMMSPPASFASQESSGDDKFIHSMQSVAGKFTPLRFLGKESVVLKLSILGERPSFYKFTTNDGKIEKLSSEYDGNPMLTFKQRLDTTS